MATNDNLVNKYSSLIVSDPKSELYKKSSEIIRAYRSANDIYSELIQNSVDAINRNSNRLNEDYRGKIKIKVKKSEKKIIIADNGIGIAKDNIDEFILPDQGDKSGNNTYGFKGYGLTYVSFVSKSISIKSQRYSSTNWYYLQLDGLIDWIQDGGINEFPSEPIYPLVEYQPIEEENEFNTIIEVTLNDNYKSVFPSNSALDHCFDLLDISIQKMKELKNNDPNVTQEDVQRSIKSFEYMLRTKTAIGNTKKLFGEDPQVDIDIVLDIYYEDDNYQSFEIPYKYGDLREHKIAFAKNYDYNSFLTQLTSPSSETPVHLISYQTSTEIGERPPYRLNLYIYAVTQTILSQFQKQYLKTPENSDIEIRSGAHLSIDGMPTGIILPGWENFGGTYKRFLTIVDVDLTISKQLDPGRKGISKYTADQINKKIIEIIRTTKRDDDTISLKVAATKHLISGRSSTNPFEKSPFEYTLQRLEEQLASYENIDHLNNWIQKETIMNHIPTSEQETLVLFFELLDNKLKGYRLHFVGQKSTYDLALEYTIYFNNSFYNQTADGSDQFGIGTNVINNLISVFGDRRSVVWKEYQRRNYDYVVAEFKFLLSDLIKDLHDPNSDKEIFDINLAVVWELGPEDFINEYPVNEINPRDRHFYGSNYSLSLEGFSIEVIVLKNFIETVIQNENTQLD